MTVGTMRLERSALFGIFQRQWNLYRRYWVWEVLWFVYGLISVLSIGYLANGLQAIGLQGAAVDIGKAQVYLLVGALMWGYMSFLFYEVAFAIAWERWEDTIEYTFMAPMSRVTHLMGICLFGIAYGLLRSALVTAVLVLTFHIDLGHADMWSAALVLATATIPLVGLGIYTSILPMISPEKGEQLTIAIQGLLLLVSGVYYPVTVLPVWLQALGVVSPLTYALQGIRDALLNGRGVIALLPVLGILTLMGVVLIPTGLWVFSRAERRAKRLGLLKRNG